MLEKKKNSMKNVPDLLQQASLLLREAQSLLLRGDYAQDVAHFKQLQDVQRQLLKERTAFLRWLLVLAQSLGVKEISAGYWHHSYRIRIRKTRCEFGYNPGKKDEIRFGANMSKFMDHLSHANIKGGGVSLGAREDADTDAFLAASLFNAFCFHLSKDIKAVTNCLSNHLVQFNQRIS